MTLTRFGEVVDEVGANFGSPPDATGTASCGPPDSAALTVTRWGPLHLLGAQGMWVGWALAGLNQVPSGDDAGHSPAQELEAAGLRLGAPAAAFSDLGLRPSPGRLDAYRTAVTDDGAAVVVDSQSGAVVGLAGGLICTSGDSLSDSRTCSAQPAADHAPAYGGPGPASAVRTAMADVNGRPWLCRRRTGVLFALPLLLLLASVVVGYGALLTFAGERVDLGNPSPYESDDRPLLVAVGDSFMSGEGAPQYLLGTNDRTNRCHRARTAYPWLVAKARGMRLASAGCSGAVAENFTGPTTQYDEPPQLDILSGSHVHDDPDDIDAVLVSIGGNDAGFGKIVRACLNEDCLPRAQEWLDALDGAAALISDAYEALAERVPPQARIIVVPYPDPFADQACVPGLTLPEIRFVREDFLPQLNGLVAFHAARLGFEVADTADAFVGARLCEDGQATDNRAMNVFTVARAGPTAGGETFTGSFHPTELGHLLLANRLFDHLDKPPPAHPPGAPGPPAPPGVPEAGPIRGPMEPPPRPPVTPPGSTLPFPAGSPCTGTTVTNAQVTTAHPARRALRVTAASGTVVCSRPY